MITIQRRVDLAVDYQASASVRWHLGQHPYIDPENASIGPIVAIEDVSIEPGGVAHLSVPGETEELLYVVSGEVVPVRAFHKGEGLQAGAVAHAIEGRDRGWYKLRNQASGRTTRVVRMVYRPDRADLRAVGVHQDLRSWVGTLTEGVAPPLAPGHALYGLVLSGRLSVDGRDATDGDGVRVEDEDLPVLEPVGRAELLLVVVPLAYPGELMWGDARYDTAET